MANVTFAALKLKADNSVETLEFAGQKIEVAKHLSTKDKSDLVDISLQESMEDGVYNEILLDAYFHFNLVRMLTNITFTAKQLEDPLKLFDIIKSSGLLDAVLGLVDAEDYDELFSMLMATKDARFNYAHTTAALVKSLITDLPRQAEAAKEIVDNFDPEQYKMVLELAKSAGMRTETVAG